MKRMIVAVALLAAPLGAPLVVSSALAEGEFSAGSRANSWNLLGEEMARFEGKVVDALCALTGDCPADCGAGKRQMGILRSADGHFLLVNKNGQPIFTGATVDLAPYCGKTVEVDGLLVGDREVTPVSATVGCTRSRPFVSSARTRRRRPTSGPRTGRSEIPMSAARARGSAATPR